MSISFGRPFGKARTNPRGIVQNLGFLALCVVASLSFACASSSNQDNPGGNGVGGSKADGGGPSSPVGGGTANGGKPGAGGTSSGGASSDGGQSPNVGGSMTGGGPSAGGNTSPVAGGNSSTGGARPGGSSNVGGRASGGNSSVGGALASGGKASGGTAASGGTTPAGGSTSTGGASANGGNTATCSATYQNPVIWEDLPDVEIIRVDDTYYYTASTFHFSPGAPILRSYDLVHWEYIGHSVPVLDFHASYNLSGSRSYVNGIWASSLQYRKSDQTFYWIGCMHNVGGGYMFTAPSIEGPWTKHSAPCYYDVGLLIDDDDKMYVAYGNNTLSVAELSSDGLRQVRTQQVFTSPSNIGTLEGSRFNKINGDYYIFTTQYANGEYVLRSTSGPFGPYTLQPFAVKLPYAGAAGSGASPHQGGIVQTQNGDWYYMAFNDSYPAGRIPILAPITWTNGWPSVNLVNGAWGGSYPFPKLPCGAGRVKPMYGTDTFAEAALEHHWEWNHNPDNTKWSAGGALTLQTATVTNDLYAARNTLTRRMPGPTSTATIELDYGSMKDGDVAGLAALRDSSAWIGIKKAAGAYKVSMVNNLTMDSSWNTSSTGTEVASTSVSGGKIWLRVAANVRTDSGGATARFYYSTDGTQFTQLGSTFAMKKDWQFFMGYRYGLFNYATASLGGSVKVASFQLTTP